ncbi:putative GRP family [Sesbania bispinosa]|nr:putative GRP family [Sesbania bispinosa]
MESMTKFWVLCLILAVAIVRLKGHELKNGTAPSQGNVTLVTLSHQGQNEDVKGKHSNEVVFNSSKDQHMVKECIVMIIMHPRKTIGWGSLHNAWQEQGAVA